MMRKLANDLVRNKAIYFMVLPVVLYYFIFKYLPMYGSIIAFKDFSIAKGVWGSPWVGLDNFKDFLTASTFGGCCAIRCS